MKIADLFEAMKPEHVSGKETPGAVEELEKRLLAAKKEGTKFTYDVIDRMMQNVCSEFNLTGQKLHDEFVAKHHMWPDNWIKKSVEEDASGVIATKKQAKDPRYSMSLTRDVRPGQIEKNLKAFNLAEEGTQ